MDEQEKVPDIIKPKRKPGRPMKRRRVSLSMEEKPSSPPSLDKPTVKELPASAPMEEKPEPEKEYIAAFICAKKGLKLWITGPVVEIIPGVGRLIKQGTGEFVQFEHGKYQTSYPANKEKVEFLLAHKGFIGNGGNRFSPDPADPTGFWLDRGFYKEENVKTRVAISPVAIIEEGRKQAESVARNFATQTQSLRTSNL